MKQSYLSGIAIWLSLFLAVNLTAQSDDIIRCYTVEQTAEMRAQHPEIPSIQEFEEWLAPKVAAYKKNYDPTKNNVITIPVVVHVLHNGEPINDASSKESPNISDAQVFSQIKVLNDDFRRMNVDAAMTRAEFTDVAADVELSFVMAQTGPDGKATNGINRVNVMQDGLTRDDIQNTWKPATQWDPTQYLNMWSVKFGGNDTNLLGYAQFPDDSGLAGVSNSSPPETDGVVMRFNSFGTIAEDDGTFKVDSPYDLGRTGTHEVGHWVGLRHSWGDMLGCSTSPVPPPGCSCTVDDFCEDTPNSDAANYGCALTKTSICETPTITTDQIENYMDYTNDACMNMFTEDQKARVQTVMANSPRRKELKDSPALFPPGTYVTFSDKTSENTEGSVCGGVHTVEIPVQISDIPDADVMVTVALSGNATENDDYQLASNTLMFTSGDDSPQNVTINVTEDFVSEGDEFITLTITDVTTTGTASIGFSNIEHNLRLVDDDFEPARAGLSAVEPFYTADFEEASGWTVGLQAGSVSWYEGVNTDFATFSVGSGNVAYVSIDGLNANYNQAASGTARYVSPPIDTRGVQAMTLTFDYIVHGEGSTEINYDFARVEYSLDGNTFSSFGESLVGTLLTATSGTFTAVLPAEAENIETFHLAIRWDNDQIQGAVNSIAIDNVSLAGAKRGASDIAATQTTTTISAEVSANETVHFYDANNKIIATLENGSQDLGCTDLNILSDGAGLNISQTNLGATVEAASKVVEITPAMNANTADYKIHLYYTEAEINAWINDLGDNLVPTVVTVDNFNLFKTTDADAGSATRPNTQIEASTTFESYDANGTAGYKFTGEFTGFSKFGGANISFPFTVAETITNATCFGDMDGAISLAVTDATGLVTFNWSNGTSGVGENAISGLAAGDYDVTISDTGGNSVETAYTVTQPEQIILQINTINERCDNGKGIATAIVQNATDYSINWSNGVAGNENDRTITDLSEGMYNAQVTNVNDCISEVVPFEILDKGKFITLTESIQNATCEGKSDGSISLDASSFDNSETNKSGAFIYQYDWSNGYSDDRGVLPNVPAGSYTVTVTEISSPGQEPACTTEGGPYLVTAPTSNIDVSNANVENPANCDTDNGSITVTPAGGATTYNYQWSNGFIDSGASSTISNLAAGDYTVEVTGNGDCKVETFTLTCSNDALPVQLIEFKATLDAQQNAQIHWLVGTETNVQQYEILRSSDAKNWTTVNTITATNNGHYDYADAQLLQKFRSGQTVFYQLKIVDADGSEVLSPIRQLQLPTVATALEVFPNPTNGVLNIQFTTEQTDVALVEIMALNGQVLQTKVIEQPNAKSQHRLDVTNLPAGIYFLQLNVAEGSFQRKIVVK